jgi:hypothetical protein
MKKNVLRLLAFAVMFVISLGANAQTVGQDVDHALAVEQAKAQEQLAKEQQKALKAQAKAEKKARKVK